MGLADDLERLDALHRSGALSDAEFATAKGRAMAAPAPAGANPAAHWLNMLRRSRGNAWLGGVCGGLAPATGLPAWLWRLIFIALITCAGTGLLLYVLLWILVPQEDGVIDLGTSTMRAS